MAIKLRDYQEDALNAMRAGLERGVSKQLVVLPTAAGKTVLFSSAKKKVVPGKMLVLAHRGELLQQAKKTFELVHGDDILVEVEQAGEYASLDADVIVATVQTLGRADSDRIKRFPRDHFTTVVIDEAHHAGGTQTYSRILEYFRPVLRLGVTATPQRSDGVRLYDIFDEIVYFRTIQDMISEGYLVDMVGYRINTDVDISKITTRAGDYATGELANAIDVEDRNKIAVTAYLEHAPGRKAVVFCATVEHAEHMNRAFNLGGVPSEVVVGTTSTEDRRGIYSRFDSGETMVLCNVAVLTEGFDQPDIGCIILARPTKSPVVYIQAIGRGLRLSEGKSDCIILDLCDVTSGKKPVGLPTLMGLPPDFDLEGTSVMDAEKKFKELEDKSPAEASQVRSLDAIEEAWERIDMFKPAPANEALLEMTDFVWTETGNENYVLHLNGSERFTISSDPLGKWNVRYLNGGEGKAIVSVEDLSEAFSRTDKWVKNNRSDSVKLLEADAPWRSDPPTEKQVKYLKKFKVPITSDMSKGQAQMILDEMFRKNPRPKRSAAQQYMIRQNRSKKWG